MLRADANAANGMALHPDGRLLVCEQGTRSSPARISLVDRATGEAETVVDGWGGLPLNSPNDVVVKQRRHGLVHRPVLRLPAGLPARAARSATSSTATTRARARPPWWPRGSTSPTGWPSRPTSASSTSATPARARTGSRPSTSSTGTRSPRARVFAVIDPGYPDGIKVDAAGLVYSAGPAGVQVFDPDGRGVGAIAVPGAVNLAFGGRRPHLHHRGHRRVGRHHPRSPQGGLNGHATRPHPSRHRHRRRRRRDRGSRARPPPPGARACTSASSTPPARSSRCAARTAPRWPARGSPWTRRGPRRSSCGPRARWRSRSRAAASARWRCTAPRA